MREPGFYDLTEREYHALPGPSASRCKAVARSPLYAKACMDGLITPTKALLDGRAAHFAMCFPDKFEMTYFAFPKKIDHRKNVDLELKQEYVSQYGQDFCLQPDDFEMCIRVRDRVWSKKCIREVLEKVSAFEQSVLWRHEPTGALCKIRLDAIAESIGVLVDFKTTADASKFEFQRQIKKHKYHWQAAKYRHGVNTLDKKCKLFAFIAVEKKEPYDAALYVVGEKTMAKGWEEVEPWIKVYHDCETKNEWPGYPDVPQDIDLSAYDLDDDEDDEIEQQGDY